MTRAPVGYTQADLDAVADNPEWTREDIARAKPFAQALPELAATMTLHKNKPSLP